MVVIKQWLALEKLSLHLSLLVQVIELGAVALPHDGSAGINKDEVVRNISEHGHICQDNSKEDDNGEAQSNTNLAWRYLSRAGRLLDFKCLLAHTCRHGRLLSLPKRIMMDTDSPRWIGVADQRNDLAIHGPKSLPKNLA